MLYPGVFPNLAAYTNARADLEAILLTGIPTGVVGGFQNYTGPKPADMLRLNMAIPPAGSPSKFGILGGDLAGFPNGRRPADDVVAIELRAVAGATIPLVDPAFTPDGAASALTDGTASSDNSSPFLTAFPYLGTPVTLPGTVEAENFDNGGSGVAYSDTTAANEGGAEGWSMGVVRALIKNVDTRRERWEGRDYIVFPVVALKEGVHNGSEGPLLYPEEELEKFVEAWNNRPVPVFHPIEEDGRPVSSNTPAVISTQSVGHTFNFFYDRAARAHDAVVGTRWADVLVLLDRLPRPLRERRSRRDSTRACQRVR